MEIQHLKNILESCLLVAGKAMSVNQLEKLFDADIDRPERSEIKEALIALQSDYEGRGIELVEVASGWRLQSKAEMEHWVSRLFQEKSPRYSRALLETLVLIAYRQPITRGEIEEVRGVAVSSNIIKTLQEREWVKEIGYKDVPGKPALWGTTRQFLDYFNLKRLDELPTLAEAQDLEAVEAALVAEGTLDPTKEPEAANEDTIDDELQVEANHPTNENDEHDNELQAESSINDQETDAHEDSLGNDPVVEALVESTGDEQGESSDEQQSLPDEALDLAQLADNLAGSDAPSIKDQLNDVVSQFIESNDATSQDSTHTTGDSQNDTSALSSTGNSSHSNQQEIATAETAEHKMAENVRPEIDDSGTTDEGEAVSRQSATAMSRTQVELMADVAVLEDDPDNQSHDEFDSSSTKAMGELRRVVDEFAEEHQKEIEAQRQIEQMQASSHQGDDGPPTDKTISLYGASGVVQSENVNSDKPSAEDENPEHPKNNEP